MNNVILYTDEIVNEVYEVGKYLYDRYLVCKDGPNKQYWESNYTMATWYFDNYLRYLPRFQLMELYYSTYSQPEIDLEAFWMKLREKFSHLTNAGHMYTAEDIAYYLAFRHINSERWP